MAALLASLVGRDLVQWILDLAEYWVRHREQGTKKCVVQGKGDGEERELLCLTTSNISGRAHNPLRKVIFKITSHDQGWRNQSGSWTWFEAGCYRDSHELSRRIITYNVPASSFPHVHIKVWECGADAGTKIWMEQFKPGDRLSIFAKARFNTWVNHIDDVEVMTFCACV
ncbi:uncharacterized protein LAESUDRAFT_723026 [Laetiporus sulphureus 93-53]|uniref:Uncharacterized protein n=1 Tax=Laetiporus sulphureus 93-53 TaxID=1314785 RepID=A0A165FPS6_9APHY|nr:uncharacterized protein LAESUDRAFT_723026 [Laetiporus sulphureus 93-53]KZT09292.1 hypothetical protein LAESUDRAFT_723026 [Laetiporus sulphureus 93-53]